MYKVEQKEKWPSGPRVKEHEAKRLILGNLVYLQSRKDDSIEDLALLFHSSLTSRAMYSKLVANFFTTRYI